MDIDKWNINFGVNQDCSGQNCEYQRVKQQILGTDARRDGQAKLEGRFEQGEYVQQYQQIPDHFSSKPC